jgi:hypothetical protein
MKLTVNQAIIDIDDSEFKVITKKAQVNEAGDILVPATKETLLLVDVIINSLTMTFKEDAELAGSKKLELIDLARRTHKARGTFLELTTDEATLIKKRVEKGYTALVFENVHTMIEKSTN